MLLLSECVLSEGHTRGQVFVCRQGLFQEIEYEQLQLGLALSASLEDPAPGSSREVVGGAGGAGPEGVPGTGVVGKRKAKARGRKRAKL